LPTVIGWLAAQRNDLEAPAVALQPVIGETLEAVRALPGARLTRMSGSGATVFALFDTRQAAEAAGRRLAGLYPDWWIRSAILAG
jgi:4-diphosphocytidyl-2-C-methyl-D-erythritol kinase